MQPFGLRSTLAITLISLACQARAQDANEAWIRELPSVKVVRTKIKGKDSRDTAAKQAATFEALKMYIAARTGSSSAESAPPAVAKINGTYQSAQAPRGAQPPAGLTPEASGYVQQGTPFQLEVLSALLSAESVAHYQSSAPFQKQQADEARAGRLREAKQKTTADLNVLGVTLLEPLSLPPCVSSMALPADLLGIGRGAPETCQIGTLDSLPRGLAPAIRAMLTRAQVKYTWASVMLADSVCPAWMKNGGSCLLMVAIADGVSAGAFVPTGLDAKTIESLLAGKYKQAAVDGDEIQCGNRRTRDVTSNTLERIWALPGLAVSFEPVSRDCTHGRILVQTALLPEPPAAQVPAATP